MTIPTAPEAPKAGEPPISVPLNYQNAASEIPTGEEGQGVWSAGTLTYDRKGLVRLFSWLLWGDLAWSVRDRALGEVIKVFMKQVQASNKFVAFLTNVLPSILNLFIGPIVSYKSDRHRSSWGRRRPFLIIGVPLAALCIIGMGLSWTAGKQFHAWFPNSAWTVNSWALLWFAVFFVVYDVAAVLSGSVFGAFFNDVVPRNVLGRFWGFVRVVSIAVVIAFNLWVLGIADKYLSQIFIYVGIIYGIGFTSSVIMVKEGQYPPPEGQRDAGRSIGAVFTNMALGIQAYFKECFTKPFYLWVFAAMILPNTLAFSSIYSWSYFFATSKPIGLTTGDYAWYTALYFIFSLPLAPLQGWLADKIHPLRVAMIVLALHIPAALWGGFFIHDGRTFAVAFVATGLLQVLYGTATAALWPLIFPKSSFAQLSSASGLIATLIGMSYGLALGWFLDLTGSAYRYTFIFAGVLDILGLVATIVMYQKFKALGGTKGYVAP